MYTSETLLVSYDAHIRLSQALRLAPASRLKIPKVSTPEIQVLADGVLGMPPTVPVYAEDRTRELQPDLLLRQVMDVNLNDQEAVAKFLTRYGLMTAALDWRLVVGWKSTSSGDAWETLPDNEQGFSRFENLIAGYPALPGAETQEAVSAWVESARARAREAIDGLDWIALQHTGVPAIAFSHESVAVLLRQLRDMGRIWAYLSGALVLEELNGSWESAAHGYPAPETEEDACLRLSNWLNLALTVYSPRVIPGGQHVDHDRTSDLYRALAAQLFNDLLIGRLVKRCGNCKRAFALNLSGKAPSTVHHHRKDVVHCSIQCSRAFAQRARTKRVTAAGRLHRQGLAPPQIAEEMEVSEQTVRSLLKAYDKRLERNKRRNK